MPTMELWSEPMKSNPIPFEMQAEFYLALGHATRLRMIGLLKNGPQRVNQIAAGLQISQPTASRHLTVLRNAGVLVAHRHGTDILYRIANPKILDICDLLRGLVLTRENQRSELLRDASPADGNEGRHAR